jgi:WhiB family transcriptional regulator, redox-sensing transcriptional regulator
MMTGQPTLGLTALADLRREPPADRRLGVTQAGDSMAHPPYIRRDGRLASGVRRPNRARSRAEVSADPSAPRATLGLPCQLDDPDLWFAEAPAVVEIAKALCAGCPAQQMCLAGALERREPCGVWGGQIFQQGRIVSHKRPRGRPRKDSPPASGWG